MLNFNEEQEHNFRIMVSDILRGKNTLRGAGIPSPGPYKPCPVREALRKRRDKMRLTNREIAEAVGVSLAMIQHYFKLHQKLRPEVLAAVEKFLTEEEINVHLHTMR